MDRGCSSQQIFIDGTKKSTVFDNKIKLSKWYLAISGTSVKITFIVHAIG